MIGNHNIYQQVVKVNEKKKLEKEVERKVFGNISKMMKDANRGKQVVTIS